MLYQIIEYLQQQGVDKNACLHMNFEESALSLNLSLEMLDKLYDTYRARVYPNGKAYVFFDEIQNVPEWERWVRARNETENIRIIVTGASSELMSRELGTLLTRYFDDMLYKDVIRRHDIRDVRTLRNIAVFLLTQTATLISYKRLCGLFNVSQDLVQAYCHYVQKAFLLELLPFYSLTTAERIRQPFKAHAIEFWFA